jgi:hypothetical protein
LPPHFPACSRNRPGPARPRPRPRALAWSGAEEGRRVAVRRRRRSPRAPVAPATSLVAKTSSRASLSPHRRIRSLPHSAVPRAQLTPPHAEPLAGVGSPGHSSSPPSTTPRNEHRFTIAHPLLALARRGKPSRQRNCSPEFGHPHRRALLRGTRLVAPPFVSLSRALALHHHTGAREPFPVP